MRQGATSEQHETQATELDGLMLEFDESMSGHMGVGATDACAGAAQGRTQNTSMRFDVRVGIGDLGLFLRLFEHPAELTGTVSFAPLGGTFPIRDGRFRLFTVDPDTGARQMVYSFRFTAQDGLTYYLHGYKRIGQPPDETGDLPSRDSVGTGKLAGVVEQMTTLFTTVYRGEDEHAPVYAAGELLFKLADAPAMVASIKVRGAKSWKQKLAACTAFASFAYGTLRDEYLRHLRLFYDSSYQNLILAGSLQQEKGAEVPFFFVSGVHERGFPWGDDESFSDVLLAIGDGRGSWQRYCITDRALEGLELDVADGLYRYRGPLFAIREGYAASFTEMRRKASPVAASSDGPQPECATVNRVGQALTLQAPGAQDECVTSSDGHVTTHLAEGEAQFEVAFEARPYEAVNVEFPLVPELVRKMSSDLARSLRDELPGEHLLGINITPHTVTVRSGSLRIRPSGSPSTSSGPPAESCGEKDGEGGLEWKIVLGSTFGEAERGTFHDVKEPTTLYGYLCAVRPADRAARVQIHSSAWRHQREYWAKDQLEAFLGAVVKRTSSSEMAMEGGQLRVRPLAPAGSPAERAPLLRKLGDPILEVNNDHFPTGIFQRRIVEVLDPSGARCQALEEDMSLMRLTALHSARQVTVASVRDDDRFRALDRVLDSTGFDALLEAKAAASLKPRARFSIAIKPNFMFSYNRHDHTTYTDPELVHHLVRRLHSRGFAAVYVVEAQSTYGQYFDHRSVREVANYLGYDENVGYRLIDMTEDARGELQDFGPPLGKHPVSPLWKNADFRISFAKNKTHPYAYYTLNLKNIYGALPLPNKFKEYHCGRGIYLTALEYLKAFPVHYGLIDGYLSADGPFGVFAHPVPNETHTVIGGPDLVAVDWVGASKMGIDPLLSPYMKHAVDMFGKPEIQLVGDSNPYRPWLNVPAALTLLTNNGIDAVYHFGNLMYSACVQMDDTYFHYTNRSRTMRLLRDLTNPLRRTFFLRTGENPSWANRFFSWLFYRMGF